MQRPDGRIKLGRSINPLRRRDQLANQIREDGLVLVYQTERIDNAGETEHLAHRTLALIGKHIHDEWFEATPEQACEAIRIAKRQASGLELPLGGLLTCKRDGQPIETKSKVVTLRIADEIGERIRARARAERRKLSSFLALIVEDGVKAMLEAEKPEGQRAPGNRDGWDTFPSPREPSVLNVSRPARANGGTRGSQGATLACGGPPGLASQGATFRIRGRLGLSPPRVPFFCPLCQHNVADGDAQHDAFALTVAELSREIASFLRSRSPFLGNVDAMGHDGLPQGEPAASDTRSTRWPQGQ